jgi:hypothetical protein
VKRSCEFGRDLSRNIFAADVLPASLSATAGTWVRSGREAKGGGQATGLASKRCRNKRRSATLSWEEIHPPACAAHRLASLRCTDPPLSWPVLD